MKDGCNNFLIAGHCKQCGSPIWIPDKWTQPYCPPPITYSCGCHGTTLIVDPNLKARIEKLEKEVEELKAETKAGTVKSLLKG